MRHPYAGRRAALGTRHDKGALIGPPLAASVGLWVHEVDVDTDRFGTFSGEVPRPGGPWETAVAKARATAEATGHPLALASEGAHGGAGSLLGGVLGLELVVLVDEEAGLVVGEAVEDVGAVTAATTLAPGDETSAFLARAQVPPHHLVVHPADGSYAEVRKGVGRDDLASAVEACAAASADGRARVETDLRAHRCPSRRPLIARAAEALGRRLACRCPACGSPGFGRVATRRGVPCAWCGTEVDEPNAAVLGCPACPETLLAPRLVHEADPGRCPACNP